MVRVARGLSLVIVTLAVLTSGVVIEAASDDNGATNPTGKVVRVAQKPKTAKKKLRGKKSAASEDDAMKAEAEGAPAKKTAPEPAETATTTTPAAGDDTPKFSRDIAPILVANCAGCHMKPSAAKIRGDFEMTTFAMLMKGAKKETVIEPGKPEESHLVLRIKKEENPKMPPGGMNNLADVAIEKIEKWVKAGALLDAGKDPDAPIASYAASPEDIRKSELAKMSTEERDKHVETVGLERWKKATAKVEPEVITGKHFLLFSALPKTRASALIKKMDDQYESVRTLLGKDSVEWGEKASLFVFNDASTFGEFVQVNENRQVEASDVGTARFTVPEPYVAVVDPMGGRDAPEPAAAAPKKSARTKRKAASGGDDAASEGPERTLAGILIEHFVSGAAMAKGKPPRWLTLGLGALVASHVEPGSPYYRKIRHDAFEAGTQGWTSKANDALGDQETVDIVRAVGFSILEWIQANSRTAIPMLLNRMKDGGGNLDESLQKVIGLSREQFLAGSGQWVASRYGR